MILYPDVKKFIETYIEDIEDENFELIFEECLGWFNNVEFEQFRDILDDLDYDYDIYDPIYDIIRKIYKEIIRENDGEYICIEDEWYRKAANCFGNMKYIIDQFSDFDINVKNSKHYCTVHDW